LRREHAPAVRVGRDLREQLALADAGLADHDERPRAADASFLQHRFDAASLGDPSDEHGMAIVGTRLAGHKSPRAGIFA
jgi:hypothetical protein